MKLEIHHRTVYRYSSAPRRAVQTLRLSPSDSVHQRVLHWQVQGSGQLQSQQDTWGNPSHLLTCERPSLRLVSESRGQVHTLGCATFTDQAGPPPWMYLRDSTLVLGHPELAALGRDLLGELPARHRSVPYTDELLALARTVTSAVRYASGHTDANTTALQALRSTHGVCQDHAHVYIAVCRSLGLPARYVSGYLHAPGFAHQASHAWVDVCLDPTERRWFSIDVTHGCPIDERHVRLAVGPDYAACPPVVGVRSGGGDETLQGQIEVREV